MDPAILKPIDLALPKPIYYTTGNWCRGAPHCLGEQNKHFPDDYKVADATKLILKSFWTVNFYIQTRAHGITMCVIKYLHLSQHVSPSKAAAALWAVKAE